MSESHDDVGNKPVMTEAQFHALVKLMRGDLATAANIGAHLVLVKGFVQADAMRETGVTRSTIGDAVKRYKSAFEAINVAWGLAPAKDEAEKLSEVASEALAKALGTSKDKDKTKDKDKHKGKTKGKKA